MALLVINQTAASVTCTEVFSLDGTPNTMQKHQFSTALQVQERISYCRNNLAAKVALPSILRQRLFFFEFWLSEATYSASKETLVNMHSDNLLLSL